MEMEATSHQVLGLTAGIATITGFQLIDYTPDSFLTTFIFIVVVLVGSLFPDIDTPTSKLGRLFWNVGFLLLIVAYLMWVFYPEGMIQLVGEYRFYAILLFPLLFVFKGHRKFTHSLLFLALVGGYGLFMYWYFEVYWLYLLGFFVGVLSHLLGDYITKRGIPLFYPFSKTYYKFFVTFKTGSTAERLITFLLIVLNLYLLLPDGWGWK